MINKKEEPQIILESLKTALVTLLGQKSFDAITVSQLCQKAGIARSTFYQHFANKVDLVHSLIRRGLNQFDQQYHPASIQERLGEKYIHEVWHYLLQDKEAILAIHRAGLAHIYLDELNKHLLKLFPYRMSTSEKINLYGMAGAQYNIIFNLFTQDHH